MWRKHHDELAKPVSDPAKGATPESKPSFKITRFISSDSAEKPPASPSPLQSLRSPISVPPPETPAKVLEKKLTPPEKSTPPAKNTPPPEPAQVKKTTSSAEPPKQPVPEKKDSQPKDAVPETKPAEKPLMKKEGFKWTPIRVIGLLLLVALVLGALYLFHQAPQPNSSVTMITPIPAEITTPGSESTPSDLTPTLTPQETNTPVPEKPVVPAVPVKTHKKKPAHTPTPTVTSASGEPVAATQAGAAVPGETPSAPASSAPVATPTEETLPVYSADETALASPTPSAVSTPIPTVKPASKEPSKDSTPDLNP